MTNRFEQRYRSGDTPWDYGAPDINLIDVVEGRPISKCKALDVGCGTGSNVIWLAQQHFEVTGCDISETAIEEAKRRASESKVSSSFFAVDFLSDKIPGSPFDFVFDRGCFHSFDTDKERRLFSENVSLHLGEGGLWLSLVGNADDKERENGPPLLTAKELVASVEPNFEIISLTAGRFGANQPEPAKAWICLMQKRTGTRQYG